MAGTRKARVPMAETDQAYQGMPPERHDRC